MANTASKQLQSLPYSSAELSYIRTSLSNQATNTTAQTLQSKEGAQAQKSSSSPLIIRPDARSPTTFRPLTAETGILPLTNGSARVCLADGSEAVVGVKADVEEGWRRGEEMGREEDEDIEGKRKKRQRRKGTVSVSVDLPGFRDDDALPTYLAAMIKEGLVSGGNVEERLRIRGRFAWKLYVDILLLHSTPLSYPLPLLSLATHLALLDTRLPALVSNTSNTISKPHRNSKTNYVNPGDDNHGDDDYEDDDPLFADDWGLAEPLFPLPSTSTRGAASSGVRKLPSSPPVTLLVMAVDESIIFDPSAQELAVADGVLAVTVGYKDVNEGDNRKDSSNHSTVTTSSASSTSSDDSSSNSSSSNSSNNDESNAHSKTDITSQRTGSKITARRPVRLLSTRTIDPPSRLTHSGLPNALNPATGGTAVPPAHADLIVAKEELLAKRAAAAAAGEAAATAEGRVGEKRNGTSTNTGGGDSTSADHGGVWSPPRGGLSRSLVKKMVDEVVKMGGVGEEVLTALEGLVKRS